MSVGGLIGEQSLKSHPCRFRLWILTATLCAAATLIADSANAHSYKLGAIEIGHLWARPPTNGSMVVLGPLFNTGPVSDRLVTVKSMAAGSVALHAKVDGKDQILDGIDLPPGKPVSLAPWSATIVLAGVTQTPREGSLIPLTLGFARAGEINVEVLVERAPSE
jgi:periplasmic copper chaperone A